MHAIFKLILLLWCTAALKEPKLCIDFNRPLLGMKFVGTENMRAEKGLHPLGRENTLTLAENGVPSLRPRAKYQYLGREKLEQILVLVSWFS